MVHPTDEPDILTMRSVIPSLFDAYYYRQSCPLLPDEHSLYQHYKTSGWRCGLSPSPYFLAPWYVRTNEDVLRANTEPLQHFLEYGLAEFRKPHPLFDMRWYDRQYRSDPEYKGDPVGHYLRSGWARGLKPHPLFWTGWYATKYLRRTPDIDPFYHYLTEGWRRGNWPNPLFDPDWYLRQASEGSHAVTADPLTDYVLGWHETFDPHPLFDTDYYLSKLDLGDLGSDRSALELYLTDRSGVSPCPLFDQSFFVGQIGAAELGATPPLIFYLEQQADSGADPHPFFSRQTYRKHAPDVARAGGDPLYHYALHGWKECRRVHPLFEADYYSAEQGKDFADEPLAHYLLHGQRSGALPRRPKLPDQTTRPLPKGRQVIDLMPDRAAGLPVRMPTLPRKSIGAFIHIYYPELAEEMLGYANHLPDGASVLYISTDTLTKAKQIDAVCRAHSKHPFEIRVMENRGRDIAPFLVGFADKLREVTYGVHVHTKRSTQYDRGFDAWRNYLLTQTLGSRELVQAILALLMESGIGLVAPDHFEPIKSLIQWGGNFEMTSGLLELAGETLSAEHILDFPSGSMFWFKADALKKLLGLNLRFYHFEPEEGQYDGTLAHAIERSLFYFVEAAGYRWLVTRSRKAVADRKDGKARNGADATHRPGNRIFPTNLELGLMRHHYRECTGCAGVASEVWKPRINLLIPTVDTSEAYAGVATALDFFAALRTALGGATDARILTTDASPRPHYLPPPGYTIAGHFDADVAGQDVIEDASRRNYFPIVVRDDDVFVATAWWTAGFALECLTLQDRLHGAKRRKMIYLVQDFEPAFYAHSTKYVLAERTYLEPARTIPVFNCRSLVSFFAERGYFGGDLVLDPPISKEIAGSIRRDAPKEKIVLLYARPHAERNCLPFLDMLVAHAVAQNPGFWSGWRFCAIGETFSPDLLRSGGRIEVLGRLTVRDYAALASRAALGVSLMVSPHPSYPPLEMAEAGVLVLANTHGGRDLSTWHSNIHSFDAFDLSAVAGRLLALAETWTRTPAMGWSGRKLIDWFFGGRTNMEEVCGRVADEIRVLVEDRPDRKLSVVQPAGAAKAKAKPAASRGVQARRDVRPRVVP